MSISIAWPHFKFLYSNFKKSFIFCKKSSLHGYVLIVRQINKKTYNKKWMGEFIMANKALESTVLSIEVQSAIGKDGNPTFTKKKIGNLVSNADLNKVQEVAGIVSNLLSANTRNIYVTEMSQIQE